MEKEKKSPFEALLQKNAVEGFNPYDAVVGYAGMDGSVRLAIPAVVAMQWFLAKYPGGRAVPVVNERFSSNTYAVYDCILQDGEGKIIGMPGIGSCGYSECDSIHANFSQTAMTKSIACALRNNGFCAPFDAEYDKATTKLIGGGVPVDDPMADLAAPTGGFVPPPSGTPLPVAPNIAHSAPTTTAPVNELVKKTAADVMADLESKMAKKGKTLPAAIVDEPKPPIPVTQEPVSAQTPAPQGKDRPESALRFVITQGKAKGMTMEEAYNKFGAYPVRYWTKGEFLGQPIYEAAKAVCKFFNC